MTVKGLWIVMVLIVLVPLVALTFVDRQPTCEERGGKWVRDGSRLMPAGKVLMLYPKYRCEGAKA